MDYVIIKHQSRKRDRNSKWRSLTASLEKPLHYQRWINSLRKTPIKIREKYEVVIKVTGIKRINYPGEKIALQLQPFLNVFENGQIRDYSLGEKSSYRANCVIHRVEGPGVSNRKGLAIMVVQITNNKIRGLSFELPKKYRHNRNLSIQITLPPKSSILRILADPTKVIDHFEGLLLSYTTDDTVKGRVVQREQKQYLPPKYRQFVNLVRSSNLAIGRVPT